MATVCPSCGATTGPQQRFCLDCGTQLEGVCPTCGASRVAGARFCGSCGTRFDQEAAAPPHLAAVAPAAPMDGTLRSVERRLVSVLFADLVGFTSRSESLDPEHVRDFLTRYFEAAEQVIRRYDGTVEKFIGDAVMAVWGTPVAQEDDAERAVRAALELVDAVRALGGLEGTQADAAEGPIELRAAVMTGEAAVNLGAIGQGMVTGDLVNTCSRLQSAAAPGMVLVDEATQRATREAIAFEPAGERSLRGKATIVPAWHALRVVAERGGIGRSDALEAPFVGREEELRLLKDQLHATGREGKARLVTIYGEAGMGKSRLIWEFLKYVDGVSEGIYWHQGRSPAYGEGIAYWALGEMVRRRAGISDQEDDATARPKLAETVAEFVADEDERHWIEPRLAALLGMEDAPADDREELFAAWRRFFERIADQATTALVFEDLHRADQALLDFIEELLEWSRAKPILVIGLARPELLERRPTWGSMGRASVALHLEPFARDGITELLEGLVPGLPLTAMSAIAERAEGVPLFAVETVRMLLDDGRMVRDGGQVRLTDPNAPIAVPPSLHALIAARLDALSVEDRSLLQDAAVLGKTFSTAALSAVAARDPADVEERLRALQRKDLVTLDSDPRSPEHGQFGFVHGLFREIAYGTLAKRERRSRHLAAARYFEALGDEELTGVLASHYLDAYRAAPEGPEGEAVGAQARIALRAAAERALALHANVAAMDYLDQALTVTTDRGERVAIGVRLAEPADATGNVDRAITELRGAIAWYQTQTEVDAELAATVRLAEVYIASTQVEEAGHLVDDMLRRLPEGREDRLTAQIYNVAARAFCFQDRFAEGYAASERGLAIAEHLGLEVEVAELFITKSWAVDSLGRAREASLLAVGGLDYGTRTGRTSTQMRARMNLSNWYMTDDPRRGVEVAQAGVDIAFRVGHPRWAASLAGNRGACALLAGEWASTLVLADSLELERIGVSRLNGIAGPAAVVQAYMGIDGRWAEVLANLGSEISTSESSQDRAGYEAYQVMLAFARGDLEAAIARSPEEVPVTGEAFLAMSFYARSAAWLGQREPVMHAIRVLDRRGETGGWMSATRRHLMASQAVIEGDPVTAERLYRDAIARFRQLDLPPDLALTGMELLRVLGPEHPERDSIVAEVEAQIARLSAVGLQAKLDEIVRVGRPVAGIRTSA